MAGSAQELSDEEMEKSRKRHVLATRDDLADAFGLMLSIARHGPNESGKTRFGYNSLYGMSDNKLLNDFTVEMRELLTVGMSELAARGIIERAVAENLSADPYQIPPAAQEWPKIFFDLYRDARPFLGDGASLLAWGYFFKDMIREIKAWALDKEIEQGAEDGEGPNVYHNGMSAMPKIVFTRPAILALCYADLIDRYGVSGEVRIDVKSRLSPFFTSSADHPGGNESYLVRADCGDIAYFYIVLGDGDVLEHYSISPSGLKLLELPVFVELNGSEYTGRIGPESTIIVENID